MKILLVVINAKCIHSNLGIHSLKAYARRQLEVDPPRIQDPVTIRLAEYIINYQLGACLQDLYRRKPDVIGFSCYIWNIESIRFLAADIRKLLPHVPLWLDGLRVFYDAGKVLQDMSSITGVMKGGGEETFAQLVWYYVDNGMEDPADCGKVRGQGLPRLVGLTCRGPDGVITDTGICPTTDLSCIPFFCDCIKLEEPEHRTIYYESSRGCPFPCSYCLSSINKQIRFRSLDLVKEELLFFLNVGVPQVKFTDRTFNCKKSHAMTTWRWIQEHNNGAINFHFEIVADLLGEEETEPLAGMCPGLVQLEISVQTTNVQALEVIRRKTDIDEIRRITSRTNAGRNVYQHLDLIAGPPYEGMESFQESFDDVYPVKSEQLQLGLLKVLRGSHTEERASGYGLVYSSTPPYEVLSIRRLSHGRILEFKIMEDMVEVHYSSRQFTCTLKAPEKEFPSPYQMFLAMGEYYQKHGLTGMDHSHIARYEILFTMIEEHLYGLSAEAYRDRLTVDLYLRENVKNHPSFARDQVPYKSKIRDFFISKEKNPRYLAGYGGFDSRQMSKMAHAEAMGGKTLVLFDYRNQDPLTYNARACVLELN